ncbi:MAG: hypothetical protein K6F34_08440 [Lachnospiraceae bacterium]|nr:hypothetical protein [Lachnospiraceae bacterium]
MMMRSWKFFVMTAVTVFACAFLAGCENSDVINVNINLNNRTKDTAEAGEDTLEDDNSVFALTIPEEYDGTYVVMSGPNGYSVYDKEAMEADFGGFVFSVYAYTDPSEYAGGMDMKVGEIISDDGETLYDIVRSYASDIQYDYTKYEDHMPKTYEALYNGAEDMIKSIKPLVEGSFVWRAGCDGEGMYDEVLLKHITAVNEKWDAGRLEEEDMSPQYAEIMQTKDDPLAHIGYAYRDVNCDGIDELLIGEILTDDLKGTIYDIYTMVDRKCAHVVSGTMRDRYYALEYGMICNEYSGGAGMSGWESYDIEPNTVNLMPQLGLKEDTYEDEDAPWFVSFGEEDVWEPVAKEEFDDYRSRFEYVRFDLTPLSDTSVNEAGQE